jgi:glutathione S-transferase
MLTVYGDLNSGNCLKVAWACRLLGIEHRWTDVPSASGATQTQAFAALNPARQIPVIRLTDGRTLAQSNAIVLYLAEGSHLIPASPWQRAKMMEWLFWEQYSHEPVVAVRRALKVFHGLDDSRIDPQLLVRGTAALELMDQALGQQPFLTGWAFTAADLCLLPYTRLAPEGGLDLGPLGRLTGWIGRCEAVLGL